MYPYTHRLTAVAIATFLRVHAIFRVGLVADVLFSRFVVPVVEIIVEIVIIGRSKPFARCMAYQIAMKGILG